MKDLTKRDVIHWVLGILLCCLGVSLCTKAHFGLSMLAAVPYAIHVGFRDALPWLTQGRCEYLFQAFLMILTCFLVWRYRWRYWLSFGTAFLCGLCIDGWLWVLGGNAPYENIWIRILAFVVGLMLTSVAIAFFFRSKMPPQVYELTVAEISDRYGWKLETVKLFFDVIMFILAVVLSALLTGSVLGAGVGSGTIIITLLNAPLIQFCGKLLDKWNL